MNNGYWAGGYTLEDLVKYCQNSGLEQKDIRLIISEYDIDEKTSENKGAKKSQVENFRLCITDSFLELMVRKNSLRPWKN